MAGDWIKMRGNLWDDPRVARLCDLTDCGEAQVIGALYWLWSTADQHTEDGIMHGLTLRAIDRKTGTPGLGAALVEIGWLADHPEGVRIVNFEEHNGASAKKRAATSKRVANHRSNADVPPEERPGNADVTQAALQTDDASVTGALAREEKRREEEDIGAVAPAKKVRRSRIAEDFTPNDAGTKAASDAGIDIKAEIARFIDHHSAKGSVMADWQAAWRTWVSNAVSFGRGSKKAVKTSGDWFATSGFLNVYEANNAGCFEHNARQFRDGKRMEAA